MIPVIAKSGLVPLCAFFLLTCRPMQSAFFQKSDQQAVVAEAPDPPLPFAEADSLPIATQAAELAGALPTDAAQVRHPNPDAQRTRRHTWLNQSVLFPSSGDSYTAQRLPATFTTRRAVPKGAIYALGGSVLPYGLLLFSSLPVWAWIASLTLPLAAMFLAAGALAKMRRNKAQYRGKGLAITALLLATSYMGIVLYAVAALAASGVLWE